MLEDGDLSNLSYMKEATELANMKADSGMEEDTKIEVCSPHPKDPDAIYEVTTNEERCGEVEGNTLFMCKHHYQYLAEKRSQFPI